MYTLVARNVIMTIQVEHIATTILVSNTNLKKSSTTSTMITRLMVISIIIIRSMVTSITTIRRIDTVNLSMKK